MAPSQRNPEDRPVAALLAPDIVALLEESPSTLARRDGRDAPGRPGRRRRASRARAAESVPRRARPVARGRHSRISRRRAENRVPRDDYAARSGGDRHRDDAGRSRRRPRRDGRGARRGNPLGDSERGAARSRKAARVRPGFRGRSDDDRVRLGVGGHDGRGCAGECSRGRPLREEGGDAQHLHD